MTMLFLLLNIFYNNIKNIYSTPPQQLSSPESICAVLCKGKPETDSQQAQETILTLEKKLFTRHVTNSLGRNKVYDHKGFKIIMHMAAAL